jgi:hypothetical protein
LLYSRFLRCFRTVSAKLEFRNYHSIKVMRMHQALSLWGYDISAAMAVGVMAGYIVVSAIAVIAIPWVAI